MAINLQSKLPSSDTIRIYDINTDSVTRFAAEVKSSSGANVEIAATAAEAAENAVSLYFLRIACGAARVLQFFI